MKLYVMRHGIAADATEYANDANRPLTPEGDRKTTKIAQRLHKMQIDFDLILTSPLLRAQQTAKILQKVGLSEKIEVSPHLAPSGDIQDWVEWLEPWRDSRLQQGGSPSLAIVGHQPNLGNWAEILLWGQANDSLVVKKAGILGLTLPKLGSPIARSELFWLTQPKYLLSDL